MPPSITNHDVKRLKNRVILIINGLSESGRVLAGILAQQGSDIAIVSRQRNVELARRIQRDVATHGRRCLIITPEAQDSKREPTPFSDYAWQKIMDVFCRVDAFISYSAEAVEPEPFLFDPEGLTFVALRHIVTQASESPSY